MSKRVFCAAILFGAALLMTGCASSSPAATETKSEPTDKKEAAAPVEPVLGKTAFWEMYRPAREWAKDVQVLSLASDQLPNFKVEGGKAPIWIAVFVSPSLMKARTFYYSIADNLPETRKGVTPRPEAPWSGPTPKSAAFQTTEFQINSDAAYDAAHENAQTFLKAHKDLPLTSMALFHARRFSNPVWYVKWGTDKLGYGAYVDAVTGKIVK